MSIKDFAFYNQRGTGKTTAMFNNAIRLAEENNHLSVLYVVHHHSEVRRLEDQFFPDGTMPANLRIVYVEQQSAIIGNPFDTQVIFDPYVLELEIADLEAKNRKLQKLLAEAVR